MKKKFCLIFAFMFLFLNVVQFPTAASDIMPRSNNTLSTNTSFIITSGGNAIINLNYEGYPNVTTGATISIKIEKRVLLAFWTEVVSKTFTVTEYRYSTEFICLLDKTGTYRCTVEYTISGTGGTDDEITFQDTKTYG